MEPARELVDFLKSRSASACTNIFICELTFENFCQTEFIPTTHLLCNYDPMQKIEPVTFCTGAGQCLMFDYRVKHR